MNYKWVISGLYVSYREIRVMVVIRGLVSRLTALNLSNPLLTRTLGILKVVGHRQAATATRTTFPGGPKSHKPTDGRQKPFCGENKVD